MLTSTTILLAYNIMATTIVGLWWPLESNNYKEYTQNLKKAGIPTNIIIAILNEDLDFNEHSFSNYIKDQVKKA